MKHGLVLSMNIHEPLRLALFNIRDPNTDGLDLNSVVSSY